MADDHGYEAAKNEDLAKAVRDLVTKNEGQEPKDDPKPTKIFMNTGVKKNPK